jgi:hypothetical protein
MRYHYPVKSKPQSEEYTRFENVLGKVMRVSKAELDRRIAADNASRADKPKRGPKPKTSVSCRASSETD